MSDARRPLIIWTFRNANRDGKKTLRFELFPASRWSFHYDPVNRTKMFPKPPLTDRRDYWRNMYRIRANGKWMGEKGFKYSFYSIAQAAEMAEKMYMENRDGKE